VESGVTDLARTLQGGVQVFLVFVIPLLIYFKRRHIPAGRTVLCVLAVYAIWFISCSPTHEGAHLLAGVLAGMEVRDYQLVPPFWTGDFVHGYVSWHGGASRHAMVASTMAPYALDGVLLTVWAATEKQWTRRGPLAAAMGLGLTCLRCVYDVSNNYLADTIFGGNGDIRFLLANAPRPVIHGGAWALMLGGVWYAVRHTQSVEAFGPADTRRQPAH
jgi:hypothetical protein